MSDRSLQKVEQEKQRMKHVTTDAIMAALRRPWYQFVGGAATRSAAAQLLAERPADRSGTLPALCVALGDSSKRVIGDTAEAICVLMREGKLDQDELATIAQAAAGALRCNLWGIHTPMLLHVLARCGKASTPHISSIEMSARYAHLATPPFVGRLQTLWANCAMVLAGTSSTDPLKAIGSIIADYAKSLTQSPSDRVAEIVKSAGSFSSGVSVAASFLADAVSDFGFDTNLLDVLELLGGAARPLRAEIGMLAASLQDGDEKESLKRLLATFDQSSGTAILESSISLDVIQRATLNLTDGSPGNFSAGGAVNFGSLMAEHRRILEELSSVDEQNARLFMQRAGVADPIKIRQSSADKIFANIRSAAMHDSGVANLYFLSISGDAEKRRECLYAHYAHSSGYPYGLIVCKLVDGSFLTYNDGEIGKRLGLVTK